MCPIGGAYSTTGLVSIDQGDVGGVKPDARADDAPVQDRHDRAVGRPLARRGLGLLGHALGKLNCRNRDRAGLGQVHDPRGDLFVVRR